MYWHLKTLTLFFLILRTFLALQSTLILRTWVLLELRTLRFIFFLALESVFFDSFQEIIKLFLIQAIRGIILLITFVAKDLSSSRLIRFIIILILLFKIGAAPFHFWLIKLSEYLTWRRLFLFLTVQKFIPLQIISSLAHVSLNLISLISFIVAGYIRFFLINLKNLIIVSSLFFIGIIFLVILNSIIWIELLILYSFIFLPLNLYFWLNSLQMTSIRKPSSTRFDLLIVCLFIISLSGLPPFPGFFIKYFWLLNIPFNMLIITFFLLVSRLIIYMYLGFIFSSIRNYSQNFLLTRTKLDYSTLIIFSIFRLRFFRACIYFF